MLDADLKATKNHATNTEEQRAHLEELQKHLFARLKAEKQLYATIYYPEQEQICPECKETLHGYYWELNNPVNNKSICNSFKLIHYFTTHEQTFMSENMFNVSGTRVGDMRMTLELAMIAAVLKGADVPADVLAEAQQALELQKKQLADAGAFVASGGH